MNLGAIIFDLDGTLLDTLADLTVSLNQALAGQGLAPHPPDRVRRFVGDGVETLIYRAAPALASSPEQQARLAQDFRGVYARRWAESTAPYPGVVRLLLQLRQAGIPMAVLSNKPHDFTLQMVERLLPPGCFASVMGAGQGYPLKPDPTAALHLARTLGLPPARCALVGDGETDMAAARAAGMVSVAVSWGFRDEPELKAAGAAHLLHAPEALLGLVAVGD